MALDDSVAEKLITLNEALDASGLPYAFGGAIALAYCVREARGTHDLDINVFVPPTDASVVVAALPKALSVSADELTLLERDAQVRLHWGDVPVDVFLSNHPFHDDAFAHVRRMPFVRGITIPVLSCLHLAVFKTFFNRRKDYADIAHMVEADELDVKATRATIRSFLGEDPRLEAFDDAVADGRAATLDPMGGKFEPPGP